MWKLSEGKRQSDAELTALWSQTLSLFGFVFLEMIKISNYSSFILL